MLTLRRSIRLQDQLLLPNGDRLFVHLDVEAQLPALIRAQNNVILAARASAEDSADETGRKAGFSGMTRPGDSKEFAGRDGDSLAATGAADRREAPLGPTSPGNSEGFAGRSCDRPEGRGAADRRAAPLGSTSPGNSEGFAGRSCDSRAAAGAADPGGRIEGPTRGERIENSPTRSCGVRAADDAADTSDPFLEAYRALLQITLGRDGLNRALAAYDGELRELCTQLDGWIGAKLAPRIRAASARRFRRRRAQARRMLRRAR